MYMEQQQHTIKISFSTLMKQSKVTLKQQIQQMTQMG